MLKLLGLDFETQDDKPHTTNVTEVGASLWEEVESVSGWKSYVKIEGLSKFCYESDYPPQTPFIVELTGITDEMLSTRGEPRTEVFVNYLFPLVQKADVIFAHKKSFDQTIFEATCKKFGLEPPRKEWVCTLTEVEWPKTLTCHKLSHLAYEHGIMVDPRTLHRAENDCDLMMKLITENYNIQDILAYAREPWVYMRAEILGPWEGRGGDGGVQKGIASKLGFTYERCKGMETPSWTKTWVGRFKQRAVAAVMENVRTSLSPFRVSVIEGIS